MLVRCSAVVYLVVVLAVMGCSAAVSDAAEVVVVGDTQLKPVVEIISGIRKTLDAPIKTYSPAEVKGRLKSVVRDEDAKVVVTLGREALAEAMALPPNIPVIFDLIVTPPRITRPNTTGFYLATPVREYGDLVRNHIHAIKRMAVVGSHDQLMLLGKADPEQVSSYSVASPVEFVETVKHLKTTDAIILLPDIRLLTSAALEQAYLVSFRKGIPLLGISERHVKEGALLALVVDMVNVGKQIGEYASNALRGVNLGQIQPSPPRKFELYVNASTARKMGIPLSTEVIRMAKRVYQ